jgi:hypothetical protein
MSPQGSARMIGAGRVVFGAAMVAVPRLATRGWVGDDADRAGTQVAVRALGIRDLILGAMTLHTAGHPQVASRWVAMCALADAVDLGATVAARDRLPRTGVVATVAIAGLATLGGLRTAVQLRG